MLNDYWRLEIAGLMDDDGAWYPGEQDEYIGFEIRRLGETLHAETQRKK